jgi:type II secretory pathway pseudopilin PulG
MIYDRKPAKPAFSVSDLPKSVFVIGIVVLLAMLGMWGLSRPSGAKARLAELEQQADQIRSAAKVRGDLNTYPLGSVCSGNLDEGFRSQLNTALAGSGLKVSALDISDRGRAGDIRPLHAYSLTLKATGTYEQAVNALALMAQYRPRLFLDSLSLRNQTESVDLNVEGRVFCRWKKQD